MLVGSCTVWSMESSLMARCRATRLSAEETIPSTRFSARLDQGNTFLALCSSTWSRQLLVSEGRCSNNFECFKFICIFLQSLISLCGHKHPHAFYRINFDKIIEIWSDRLDENQTSSGRKTWKRITKQLCVLCCSKKNSASHEGDMSVIYGWLLLLYLLICAKES